MPEIDINAVQSAPLPGQLLDIAGKIRAEGGESYIVGGWVRDCLLGISSSNYDLEIYGIELDSLANILSRYGRPKTVGRAFGVVTMDIGGESYDFAFPRTESKIGKGHKGFMVKPDPCLTYEEAAARRDFTVNSMGLRVPELELVDPHGGVADLKAGILRHVSDAFGEDPLRALRAVQFSARFTMDIDPETQKLCAVQPLEELPPERIYQEFRKLLLKADKPSIGLEWMKKMDLLRYFPELKALIGVQQDPEWHPEGDVWEHNNRVVDEAALIRDRDIKDEETDSEFERMSLMLGALCHDFGKPGTTVLKDGHWRSPAHEAEGEKHARSFLARITRDQRLISRVVAYVREHLKPALYYKVRNEIKPSAIRRLSLRVDIDKLVRMARADHFGRTTQDALERRFEAGDWLLEQSRQLNVLDQKPKPILTGKMLLSLGMKPGPRMGQIIGESFELQLDNKLTSQEDVLEWAKDRLKGES
ncbi:CCA tRNA nucleotidyltransferase [Fibrobacterota bacterium]